MTLTSRDYGGYGNVTAIATIAGYTVAAGVSETGVNFPPIPTAS